MSNYNYKRHSGAESGNFPLDGMDLFNPDQFIANLKTAMGGQSVNSVAKRSNNMSDSLLRKYLSGSIPGIDKAMHLAITLGVSLDELVGMPSKGSRSSQSIHGVTESPSPEYNSEDYVFVPQYLVQAAAGSGRVIESEQIVNYLAFRRNYLRAIGISPANAAVITAEGDSMVDTIRPGEPILVDLGSTDVYIASCPELAHIYVFLGTDSELRIKRIMVLNGGKETAEHKQKLQILSDNKQHKPEEVLSSEILVVGRARMLVGRAII